jgi:hypothetical protein
MTLSSVTFEPGCQISHLGESAFSSCESLRSICIPASVKTISKDCFFYCMRLSSVTFEPGCQISHLGESAFGHCFSLTSLSVPLSTEPISES